MAAISSTSSSKAPLHFGTPWALLLAIAILVCADAALHLIPRMKLIAYASLEGQYQAVRDTIDAQGPAEVALVGSSQMREGVTMPLLLRQLEQQFGHRVWVANYAMRGSRVDVSDALVRYLQRQPTPPKLIVVGISPRDLRAIDPDWARMAVFWDFGDFFREFRKSGFRVSDVLPIVIRNEVGALSHTLRYREKISLVIQRSFARFGVYAEEEPNPILGQGTLQHEGSRGLGNLIKPPQPLHRMRTRAAESYLVKNGPAPLPAMMTRLKSLTAQLGHGRSKAIIIEMPVADYMRQLLDALGQTAAFDKAITTTTTANNVTYLPVEKQPFKPTDAHFTDMQHLNSPGAALFTKWLAELMANTMSTGRDTKP